MARRCSGSVHGWPRLSLHNIHHFPCDRRQGMAARLLAVVRLHFGCDELEHFLGPNAVLWVGDEDENHPTAPLETRCAQKPRRIPLRGGEAAGRTARLFSRCRSGWKRRRASRYALRTAAAGGEAPPGTGTPKARRIAGRSIATTCAGGRAANGLSHHRPSAANGKRQPDGVGPGGLGRCRTFLSHSWWKRLRIVSAVSASFWSLRACSRISRRRSDACEAIERVRARRGQNQEEMGIGSGSCRQRDCRPRRAPVPVPWPPPRSYPGGPGTVRLSAQAAGPGARPSTKARSAC